MEKLITYSYGVIDFKSIQCYFSENKVISTCTNATFIYFSLRNQIKDFSVCLSCCESILIGKLLN